MNCREFENAAAAVLEGESHAEAFAHLAACPRCRLLVDELVAVEGAARALPLYEPSLRLWARLEAAAEQEGLFVQPAWEKWFGPVWGLDAARPAFAGALALILVVAAGLVGISTVEVPAEPLSAASLVEVARAELVQEPSYASRYQVHLQEVARRVEASEPTDPGLRELAAGPLGDVDRAIEETQVRLNNYPEDELTREELHRLYRQKVTVLQAMSGPTW